MKNETQWREFSIMTFLCWGLFVENIISVVSGNNLIKNAIGWKGLVEIADDTAFTGTTFVSLPVDNSQQCLRLCWLYKACTLLSYDVAKGTCHLTSLDVPDMTSYYRAEKNVVTVDMRSADVDEPKPRGCDKRPCDEYHLCAPVVKTSSYRCLSTVLNFCPLPAPKVSNALAMRDGVRGVIYHCQDGYVKSGTTGADVSTCDRSSGQWSAVDVTCTLVNCGAAPDVANATKAGNDSFLNARVTYTCLEGYVTSSTSMSIVCQDNSQWTTPPSDCLLVLCPDPVRLANANVQLLGRGVANKPSAISGKLLSRSYGGQAIHSCNPGFKSASGNFTSVCQSDGSWTTPSSFNCSAVNCGHPPKVDNALSSYTTFLYQSEVEYTCRENFRNSTADMRLKCDVNGQWEGPEILCLPVDCGTPPEVFSALASYNGTVFGSQVVYTCKSPAIPFSNATDIATCREDGNWSSETSIACISCGSPPDIGNASYTILTENRVYTAVYSCDLGFITTNGVNSKSCIGEIWTANGVDLRCVALDCGKPPTIEGATVTYSETGYQSVATYVCKAVNAADGTDSSWSLNTTCQANGTWSPSTDALHCESQDCGTPPRKPNTKVQYDSTVQGSIASYTCLKGFHFVSLSTLPLLCSSDGKWDGEDLNCTEIDCGVPPNITFANLSYNSTTYRSDVVYSCVEGYLVTGSPLKTCSASGNWVGDVSFECTFVKCQEAPRDENSLITYHGNRTSGSIAVYTCADGYQLARNVSNITCLGNGQWSREHVECVQMHCNEVPLVLNADWVVYNLDSALVVEYSCHKGYKAIDDLTRRTCKTDEGGNWSSNFIECAPDYELPCPEPETIRNASFKLTSRRPGADVMYTCDLGHEHWWFESRKCTQYGIWSDQRVECRVIDCSEPPGVAHAAKEYADTIIDSKVEYVCESGYRHSFSSFKTCQEDGAWSNDLVECLSQETTFCAAPSRDQYSTVSFTSLVAGKAIATFTCIPGYTGSAARYTKFCGQNMQWRTTDNSSLSMCTQVNCGNPPEVQDALTGVTEKDFESTTKYSCLDGFTRSGPEFRRCMENGQWESVKIECISKNAVKCPEPVNPKRSKILVNSYRVGGEMFIKCIEGYTGGGKGICSERGQWEWTTNECVPMNCSSPPEVTDASLNYTETHFGAVAVYECRNEDDRQTGPYRSTCSTTGTWTQPVSTCQPLSVCSGLPVSKTAHFVLGKDQKGFYLTYSCKKNYIPSPNESKIIRCLSSGQWSRDEVDCRPIGVCASPPEIPYASLQEVHGLPSADEPNIFSAVYACQSGFASEPSNPNDVTTFRVVCDNSTKWHPFGGRCVPVECPSPYESPPFLTNAPFNVEVSNRTHMSQARFSCIPPQVGEFFSVCQANGSWSAIDFRCSSLSCSQPPEIANGTLGKRPVSLADGTDDQHNFIADKSRVTSHSSEVWTITCDENFTYLGPDTITCSWNSTSQTDQWVGVEKGICVQVLYTNQGSEFFIDTHVDKRDYFTALKICVNGTYQPSQAYTDVRSFYFNGTRRAQSDHGVRLIIEPKKERARVQDRRENPQGTFRLYSTKVFNISTGQKLFFCLKVDYQMALYTVTLDGEGFDKYPPTELFDPKHSAQFAARRSIDIEQVKLTYFKGRWPRS